MTMPSLHFDVFAITKTDGCGCKSDILMARVMHTQRYTYLHTQQTATYNLKFVHFHHAHGSRFFIGCLNAMLPQWNIIRKAKKEPDVNDMVSIRHLLFGVIIQNSTKY